MTRSNGMPLLSYCHLKLYNLSLPEISCQRSTRSCIHYLITDELFPPAIVYFSIPG
ncbi:MAG: hypothetical protein ACKO96_42685 [Flammeovirgaceae bacterium]